MTIPRELLRIVRRKTHSEAKVGHRRGGKNFPPKNSGMFRLYKRLSDAYKRKRNPDVYYIARAMLHFARSRSYTKLAQMASFERRFGDMNLGFSLHEAIDILGVGAMRKLDFDGEQVLSIVPKTWNH
jgi:hypothetical protein